MSMGIRRESFPAMGTRIEFTVWGADISEFDELDRDLRFRAKTWESIFSRFRPDSELSVLNHRAGEWVVVSAEMFAVLMAAREGYFASAGRFDPTVLDALESAGYDRSFDELQVSETDKHHELDSSGIPSFGMPELQFDQPAMAVRLPIGVRIDLGGIAKGAFVDSLHELMRPFPGAIVDAGGDLRLWGRPGNEELWRIGIQHPGSLDVDIAELHLVPGTSLGIATSSTRSRTWLLGETRQNHLIDPRTRRAVSWDTPSITIVTDSVMNAEIQAKSVLVSLARGEGIPSTTADLCVVAYADGSYETLDSSIVVA